MFSNLAAREKNPTILRALGFANTLYEFDHPLSDGISGDDGVAAVYNLDLPERVIAYKRTFVQRVAGDVASRWSASCRAFGQSHRLGRSMNKI
jgi:hypothetical protein